MESRDCVFFEEKEYPITAVYAPRHRTVGLTIKPTEEVILRMPPGYPKEEALSFAQSKTDWIAKHVHRFRAQNAPERRYANGDTIPFLGTVYTVRRKEGKSVCATFSDTDLEITIPDGFSEEEAIEMARTAVIYLFRREGISNLKPEVETEAEPLFSHLFPIDVMDCHQSFCWCTVSAIKEAWLFVGCAISPHHRFGISRNHNRLRGRCVGHFTPSPFSWSFS